jgi:hypothetical protein
LVGGRGVLHQHDRRLEHRSEPRAEHHQVSTGQPDRFATVNVTSSRQPTASGDGPPQSAPFGRRSPSAPWSSARSAASQNYAITRGTQTRRTVALELLAALDAQ